MVEQEKPKGFWQTLPGMLTGVAAIITAITGFLKEVELLVSNTSPDGPFQSIGKFATQNATQVDNPYQEFTFQSVKAKYLKIRLLSNHNGYDNPPFEVEEFQLLGRLEKE